MSLDHELCDACNEWPGRRCDEPLCPAYCPPTVVVAKVVVPEGEWVSLTCCVCTKDYRVYRAALDDMAPLVAEAIASRRATEDAQDPLCPRCLMSAIEQLHPERRIHG